MNFFYSEPFLMNFFAMNFFLIWAFLYELTYNQRFYELFMWTFLDEPFSNMYDLENLLKCKRGHKTSNDEIVSRVKRDSFID